MPLHDTTCQLCSRPATLHLVDDQSGDERIYCQTPDCIARRGGRHGPHPDAFRIKRWRLEPGNATSEMLAAPEDSDPHRQLRAEMCDCKILGGEGACRYYLSVLTGTDQFAAWSDDFENDVRRYVAERTSPGAGRLCDGYSVNFLSSFFRRAWERSQGRGQQRRMTKEERAIELLLTHPDWSDQRIADSVPTTIKQLQRWTDYKSLRSAPQKRETRT